MKRVLEIFGEPLDNGGQEAFIMNMYRNMDREKVQFDFFTPYYCANENLRAEIESLGGRVFEKSGRFDTQGNKGDFLKNLSAFLKEHAYETVHIHSGSIFSLALGARLAKKHGAKKVIVHSHATGFDNLKYRLIKSVSPLFFKKNATHYLACSKLAAEWKFPASVIRKGQFKVIKNGINLEKFAFLPETREKYRKEFSIEDQFTVCHIGRFTEQKNHAFLIDAFYELQKLQPASTLLLVGEGPEQDAIRAKAAALGIEEKVQFLGIRTDVSEILQASDLFLFPSVFEGLGIVAIEAQATGLPVIASKGIPEEADVTPLFAYLELESGAKEWAKAALATRPAENRAGYFAMLKSHGYASSDAAAMLQSIYLED